jgi:hypothetical protein
MPALNTAKPASARHAEPVSKSERFAGELENINILHRRRIQQLIRRHALTSATAELLAPLVFGVSR